jgi:DNA-binding MarR family transcriptional regulator
MEYTLESVSQLLSTMLSDAHRAEQNTIKESGFNNISVNEAHTVEAIGLYLPKTMSTVAAKLGITMGTLTVAINQLVRKGYVNKTRSDTDRRVFMLSLTDEGKRLFKVHQRFHLELVKSIVMDLSDREADMVINALSGINRYLELK